ncbi:MAG: regulatory protein RecX [Candidatus Omnitrophica bacterium]|nr:regulatory protein RecX [Candidatus Omnitrophota bacterium]
MLSPCRAAALRFLKIRPRSIRELEVKLKDKGFAASEITEAVEYCRQSRLLDDRAFTVAWVQYRLARPFGFMRILRELKEKGVEESIIAEALARAKEEFSQQEAACALARRRAQVLSGIDPVKRKKRVLDFLVRRGFPTEIAYKAINYVDTHRNLNYDH